MSMEETSGTNEDWIANAIPEEVAKKIASLCFGGMSARAISKIEGMPSYSTVKKYVKIRLGSLEKPKPMSKITVEPVGECPVTGKPIYMAYGKDHTHIVPQAIVDAAKQSGAKWAFESE